MRPMRRITLVMRAAHSSPATTAVSLEPRLFGMWSRPASSLNQQNCEGGYGSRVRYMNGSGTDLGLEHLQSSAVHLGARIAKVTWTVWGRRLMRQELSSGAARRSCHSLQSAGGETYILCRHLPFPFFRKQLLRVANASLLPQQLPDQACSCSK